MNYIDIDTLKEHKHMIMLILEMAIEVEEEGGSIEDLMIAIEGLTSERAVHIG